MIDVVLQRSAAAFYWHPFPQAKTEWPVFHAHASSYESGVSGGDLQGACVGQLVDVRVNMLVQAQQQLTKTVSQGSPVECIEEYVLLPVAKIFDVPNDRSAFDFRGFDVILGKARHNAQHFLGLVVCCDDIGFGVIVFVEVYPAVLLYQVLFPQFCAGLFVFGLFSPW